MKKHYIIAALAILSMNASATTSPDETVSNAKVMANAEDTEDDGTVVINGFKVNLSESSATFDIRQIMSIEGEDLVVPYTLTYEGKEYHCDEVNMNNLCGEISRDNGYKDVTITPNVKSVTFSEGIKTLKGSFPLCYCKKVILPSTVESIKNTVFNYGVSAGYVNDDEERGWWMKNYNINFMCFDLEEFIVDKNNAHYTTQDGLLYTKDMKTLVSCPRNKKGIVVVPEGVEKLATGCFCICNRITEIQLPSTLKSVGDPVGRYAGFYYCLNLEKINIPEGVEALTGCAFRYCVKLKSLTLPSSLKTLDVEYTEDGGYTRTDAVFGPMYSLEELNLENTSIEVIEGKYNTTPFTDLPLVKNFKLPKNIRVLGDKALIGINPPAELHLPVTIESLGEQFIDPFKKGNENSIYLSSCKQTESPLKDIYCYWTTPLEVSDKIFGYVKVKEDRKTKEVFPQDWANICTLHVPTGTLSAYRANSVWGKFQNIVEFTPTSSIDAISDNTATNTNQGIYTLQGIRIADSKTQLDKLPSGIYIIDGKKVSVK